MGSVQYIQSPETGTTISLYELPSIESLRRYLERRKFDVRDKASVAHQFVYQLHDTYGTEQTFCTAEQIYVMWRDIVSKTISGPQYDPAVQRRREREFANLTNHYIYGMGAALEIGDTFVDRELVSELERIHRRESPSWESDLPPLPPMPREV